MQKATYEEEVLLTGQQVVDRGELAGDSDHGSHGAGLAAHVVAHDTGGAGVRLDQGGQDPDDGCLARAVGSEQSEDLAFMDAEVDAVEHDHLSVCLPQAVHGNRIACRVAGHCVHATHAPTLTLGQCQGLVAIFLRPVNLHTFLDLENIRSYSGAMLEPLERIAPDGPRLAIEM